MSTTSVTFNNGSALTLCDHTKSPNGDHWSLVERGVSHPNIKLVGLYNTAGMTAVKIGEANLPEALEPIRFGSSGSGKTRAYFATSAAARTWIASVQTARRSNPVGTLGYQGITVSNCFFAEFTPGPPRRCSYGSFTICVDFEALFLRLE